MKKIKIIQPIYDQPIIGYGLCLSCRKNVVITKDYTEERNKIYIKQKEKDELTI